MQQNLRRDCGGTQTEAVFAGRKLGAVPANIVRQREVALESILCVDAVRGSAEGDQADREDGEDVCEVLFHGRSPFRSLLLFGYLLNTLSNSIREATLAVLHRGWTLL